MSTIVLRIQDAEGRGPWRPGFSHWWVRDREDLENLPPFFEVWPHLTQAARPGWHMGCGTLTVEQLRRWFTPQEYATLRAFGFQAVSLLVDDVLASDERQCVFMRRKPLAVDCDAFDLYLPAEAPS